MFNPPPLSDLSQIYLTGVRGFLTIQSFLWVYLRTFAPVAVKNSRDSHGPLYQEILRKTFSGIFWNESLIYSAIILLSARTICIPFLLSPSRTTAASSIFRRAVRLYVPVCVSLAIVIGAMSGNSVKRIQDFASATGNNTIETPYTISSFLMYFNSTFNLFWITQNFTQQAASLAFPTQTLWVISVVFSQSFTVYMTMICIPYIRLNARVVLGFVFVFTAWWVQSWAWYTITGLLLADASINMSLASLSAAGIPIGAWLVPSTPRLRRYKELRLPSWILYALLTVSGLVMQYLWATALPSLENAEVRIHSGNYSSSDLSAATQPGQPLARDDNYLLLLGFFLFLDSTKWLQRVFANPFFLFLGRRSLSYFLTQGTLIYTVGIMLFKHLRFSQHVSFEVAVTLCLIVCVPGVVLCAEVFYRFVDVPSQKLAYYSFEWMRQ